MLFGLIGPPGGPIGSPEIFTGGLPIGGPASRFFIGGAPIAILGGVFSGGFPLGGPVTQIYRGGSAPVFPTGFFSTLTSSGPIGVFFVGSSGGPVGAATFGGGALPISPPSGVVVVESTLQPRTALVAGSTVPGLAAPALAFAGAPIIGFAGSPIGMPGGGGPPGGTPIGP